MDWSPIEPYDAAPSHSEEYDYVREDGELGPKSSAANSQQPEDPSFSGGRTARAAGSQTCRRSTASCTGSLGSSLRSRKVGLSTSARGRRTFTRLSPSGRPPAVTPAAQQNGWTVIPPGFNGAHVVIVADRDKAGIRHALRVRSELEGAAKSIRIAGAAVSKDASDHVHNGFGLDDFVEADRACDVTETPGSRHVTA